MTRWLFYFIWVCLMLSPLSCSRSDTENATQGEAAPKLAAASAVPTDLKVVIGEGGGFTGLWQGYTVGPGAALQRWRGRVPEGDPQPAGELSAADLDKLWAAIEAQGFFSMPAGEGGDLTRFIQVTAGNLTHRVQWVPQPREAQGQVKLAVLYGQCRELLQALDKTIVKPPRTRESR